MFSYLALALGVGFLKPEGKRGNEEFPHCNNCIKAVSRLLYFAENYTSEELEDAKAELARVPFWNIAAKRRVFNKVRIAEEQAIEMEARKICSQKGYCP